MPRSGHEARERLTAAALDLYTTQGYDRTTSAQIATRAGVTERTFFRHFVDKKEVLFGGEAVLGGLLDEAIARAPSADAWEVLHHACRSLATFLEDGREYGVRRYHLIETTPALNERELAKSAALAEAAARALRRRGIPERQAQLLAQAAIAALNAAVVSWYGDAAGGVATAIDASFDELRQAFAPSRGE